MGLAISYRDLKRFQTIHKLNLTVECRIHLVVGRLRYHIGSSNLLRLTLIQIILMASTSQKMTPDPTSAEELLDANAKDHQLKRRALVPSQDDMKKRHQR